MLYSLRSQRGYFRRLSLFSHSCKPPTKPSPFGLSNTCRCFSISPRNAKTWPQEDRDKLQQLLRQGLSDAECAHALGKSQKSIETAIHHSGVRGHTPPWDAADTQKLRSLREAKTPWHEIKSTHFPNHPFSTIVHRLYSCEAVEDTTARSHRQRWLQSDMERLVKLRLANHPDAEIAQQMGRSKAAVNSMSRRITNGDTNYETTNDLPVARKMSTYWTTEEDSLLRRMHSDRVPWNVICATLERSRGSAQGRWHKVLRFQDSDQEKKKPTSSSAATRSPSRLPAKSGVRTIWTASRGHLLSKTPCLAICKGRSIHSGPGKGPKRRQPKPWTNEDMEQLLHYKEMGLSHIRCGELLQRTPSSVQMKYSRRHKPVKLVNYVSPAHHAKLLSLHAKKISWHKIKMEFPNHTMAALLGRWSNRDAIASQNENRAPRRWSSEEIEILKTSREAGRTLKALAKEMGRTLRSLTNKVHAIPEMKKQEQRLWAPEEDEMLRRMHREGCAWGVIDKALGRRSRSAIFRWHRKLRYETMPVGGADNQTPSPPTDRQTDDNSPPSTRETKS